MAEANRHKAYNRRKPTLGVRMPDPDVLEAVVSASTEAGVSPGQWVRDAIAERLEQRERERKD